MATDLLGGQIDLAVMVLSSALPHIQAGRVQAYGVTGAKRSAVAPNVPALAETPALKGVDMGVWFGLMGPANLPKPVAERLNTEMQAVLALPGTHLHLYGKPDARSGRKMGHLTITGADVAGVKATARRAAEILGLPGLEEL